MRVAALLAAGAVATGALTVTSVAAPAARAAAGVPPAFSRAAVTALPAVAGRPAGDGGGTSAVRTLRPQVPAVPAVASRLAELANAATGANLWSRSSVTERPIGSITKVMTAYVVLQTPGVNLHRIITVPSGISGYDKKYDASTAGLHPGERLTTAQLLYAMMLPSGCDAAYALAAAYGPGTAGFIAKMNAAAAKLGLTKTHFTDFSGLPAPSEWSGYSTVHDLIRLGRAALRNTSLATIAAAREYKVAPGPGHRAHDWKNINPLLGSYPGAVGVKTGYTRAAGQCLLFAARRGRTTLIGVVLDSAAASAPHEDAAGADAKALLNWGFSR
jgi:D-alanyl-D-alanine carboxypeptidase (penicillin-binding protein 5/6)